MILSYSRSDSNRLLNQRCYIIFFKLPMNSTTEGPMSFVQKIITSSKTKKQIFIEQIVNALRNYRQISTLSQRALFLKIVAELINRQLLLQTTKLKVLRLELNPILKVVRKRQDADDQQVVRRRKPSRKPKGHVPNLEELSNDSINNPLNIQAQETRQNRANLQGQDASKGSKKDSHQGELIQAQLQQTTQNPGHIEGYDDIGVSYENFQPDDSSKNSSSNSSKNPFAKMISNLNQKMQMLGLNQSIRTVTKSTVRKRKGQGQVRNNQVNTSIIDMRIDLDDAATVVGQNQNLDFTLENIRSKNLVTKENELTHLQNQIFESFQQSIGNFFDSENLQRLENYKIMKRRINNQFQQPEQYVPNPQYGDQLPITQFETDPTQFYQDDTEQTQFYKQHIESNIFEGHTQMTLTQVAKKIKRPTWQTFQKLLLMSQEGEVILRQQSPQTFGNIMVINYKAS